MHEPSGIITLLTDFGPLDPYVGIMKGVILTRFPKATLVDISHQIAPQDIRQAALVLRRVISWYPAGTVHLAVVDPGVGTTRRSLVARAGSATLVAPDNGLVWPTLENSADWTCHAITRADLLPSTVSPTFHGRDVFAPIAAAIASGNVRIEDCGPQIRPEPLEVVQPVVADHQVIGQITEIDHYGNLLSNITEDHLPVARGRLEVAVAGHRVERFVRTYGEAKPGSIVVLICSFGTLEVACVHGNAQQQLQIGLGAEVLVTW